MPNTDDGTQGSQLAKACTLCASGTYRIGDASQNNNVCKKVPAGGQPVVNTSCWRVVVPASWGVGGEAVTVLTLTPPNCPAPLLQATR